MGVNPGRVGLGENVSSSAGFSPKQSSGTSETGELVPSVRVGKILHRQHGRFLFMCANPA